jgi:hypothetical protein
MIVSGPESFGPIARRLICPDRWSDKYPAWPAYAAELDALLTFCDQEGRLSQYVPRLESKSAQRDEALEELRVAYWLHHNGFLIIQWEPPGLNGKVGEYLVHTPEQKTVFVEVKSPGWEGEISHDERKAGRTRQPKHRSGEGGALGNWIPLQKCIASEKTYPKFDPAQPNLLVVADDLKVNLHDCPEHVEIALYNTHPGYGCMGFFTSSAFANLGGIGIFRAISVGRGIEYEFRVFDNPFALPTAKLPDSILRFTKKATGIVRDTYTGSMTRLIQF